MLSHLTQGAAPASTSLLESLLPPLLAAVIAASVALYIGIRYHGRQLALLQRAELTRVACSLVQMILDFRNDKEIERLRGAIRNKLKPKVDAALAARSDGPTAVAVVGDWLKTNELGVTEDQVRHFLSSMNTIAWQVLLLPSTTGNINRDRFGQRPPDRDAVIEIFYENLILEWDALAPWIQNIRMGDWWLIHLRDLVEYAKDRHPVLRADVQRRQLGFAENEKRRNSERAMGGAP